jgi:hypothetical protein
MCIYLRDRNLIDFDLYHPPIGGDRYLQGRDSVNQFERQQYLQRLLSWARKLQQQIQFDIGLNTPGTRSGDQWYSRFNHLVQRIEDAIKRPYVLQSNDIWIFHHQAYALYRLALGMYQNSQPKTIEKVKERREKKGERHNDKLLDTGVVQLNPVPVGGHPPCTKSTFMALVDAIIPPTWGTLDLRLDDYLICILDYYVSIPGEWGVKRVPLSTPTAGILDVAATQLMALNHMKSFRHFSTYPEGAFAALLPNDRLVAISLLENLHIDLASLPSPYRHNAGLVQHIVTFLHRTIMFAFYSEWLAYGSTRLNSPEDRVLERRPFIWDLVGYPGVSLGYRALRGFLIDKFNEKEEC